MVSCRRWTSLFDTVLCAAERRLEPAMSATARAMIPADLMGVTGKTSGGRGASSGPEKGSLGKKSSATLRRSFPWHQPANPADACEVVIDDRDHQHHQDDEAAEQQLLFHLETEVAAREALERHDEDVAAVEDRNRQEVQQPEVEAERRHQAEQRDPSELRRLARELRDRDGTH